MSELDPQLQHLAALAWRGGLRGETFEKNSLMAALDEVLRKVALIGDELSLPVITQAAAQDLYDHIARLRKARGYPPGRRLAEDSRAFAAYFFDEVLSKTYQGKVARLLSHEKILRSAFHSYIRQQIPTKARDGAPADDADDPHTTEQEEQP